MARGLPWREPTTGVAVAARRLGPLVVVREVHGRRRESECGQDDTERTLTRRSGPPPGRPVDGARLERREVEPLPDKLRRPRRRRKLAALGWPLHELNTLATRELPESPNHDVVPLVVDDVDAPLSIGTDDHAVVPDVQPTEHPHLVGDMRHHAEHSSLLEALAHLLAGELPELLARRPVGLGVCGLRLRAHVSTS